MSRAEVLAEALPYIKNFHGSHIVIKYGGHAMLDNKAKEWTIKDTILLRYIGMKPVVVHGGGPEITKAMEKLGKKPKFIEGLRITDEETLDIVKMVLVGKINTEIVSKINAFGGIAVGLSGKDANLIVARKKSPLRIIKEGEEKEIDLGFVGEPKKINSKLIEILTSNGYIPVISPLGITEEGHTLNLNADAVAGEIASALKAKKLIILTDVPGVLANLEDEGSLLKEIRKEEVNKLIEEGIVRDSMIPKLKACVRALDGGVEKAHIIDGRVKHSILLELFTDEGIGTMVR